MPYAFIFSSDDSSDENGTRALTGLMMGMQRTIVGYQARSLK